jgi:nucleoside-diphosphate-sugar epimerase
MAPSPGQKTGPGGGDHLLMVVLNGAEAVVHLANIPAPGRVTPAVTFTSNVTMNFNVFHAAASLGVNRVVWASRENTLGLPFGGKPRELGAEGLPPRYAPVDEDHYPLPTTSSRAFR